jgi:predicted aconitase
VAGHTPEASNADRLPVIKDAEPIGVTLATLKDTWLRFNGHARPTKIDLVSIGSPHVSVRELARLADFCAGRRRHPGVSMMVTCSRDILARTEAADHVADLERFGVQFITDTCWCMIQEPVIPKEARTVLTNSGKYAHYGPGISGRRVLLGSLSQCVDAACEGQFDTTPPSWIMADTSDKQPRGSATAARPRKDRYE